MVTKTLERTKSLVWPEINRYLKNPPFPRQFSIPLAYKNPLNLFWKINREYPERKGKYLRPTLVLLIASAMGLDMKKAVKTAAAMQLSEEWILIHDDIEDKSAVRREKPTLHKIYGDGLAVNAGDALHMIMWKIISDIKSDKITDEFYAMMFRTAVGQGIEQIWAEKNKKLSKNEYLFIADGKSAYYSMAGPMRLGAILAGANRDQLNKITDFGMHLGRCFQLVDDLIDYKQDKAEGKSTLANSKGVEYAKKLAQKEKLEARKILDKLPFLSQEPARSELIELVDFILERKY